MNHYVIVSGLPASGKSTLARAIAQELVLPVLDKDDFLEALFESRGVGDKQWRRKLSRVADQEFQKQTEQSNAAVITSWWKHPESSVDSGTPIEWLALLTGLRVEVHCLCDPTIAANRFAARSRHPGHLDRQRSYSETVASFVRQASFGPLHVGRVVEVNTDNELELETLMLRLAQAFEKIRQEQAGIPGGDNHEKQ